MAFLILEYGKAVNSDKVISIEYKPSNVDIIAKLENDSEVTLTTVSRLEDRQRLLEWLATISCFDKAIKIKNLVHILEYSEAFMPTVERLDKLDINESLIDLINSDKIFNISQDYYYGNKNGKFQATSVF